MKYLDSLFDRNIGVWDTNFQDRLRDVCVGIAGVGGASHAAVDILVRNGVGRFKLADPDKFELHNLQRQVLATRRDIGKNKAEVVKAHIQAIDPDVSVKAYPKGLHQENIQDFLHGITYVIDALDISAIEVKRDLYRSARARGLTVITTPIIGAGAGLLVFQPDGVSFEEYFDFPSYQALSPRRLAALLPDYLQDFFFTRIQQGTVPTTADGAHLTGVLAAGAIKRLLWGKPVPAVPTMLQFDVLDDRLCQRSHFPMFVTPLKPVADGLLLKLEGENPTGSIKYRLAQHLLEAPIQQGLIHCDQVVIEASSGNTGVALAMFAQKYGLRAEIYVTPDVPPELVTRIQSYGGTPLTFAGPPMELAGLLQQRVQEEGCYWPNQYTNPEAIRSYDALWEELRDQLHQAGIHRVDYLIVALGTGGSLMGLGPRMREHFQAQVIGVESDRNDPIPGIRNSQHQHLGALDLFDTSMPDQMLQITHKEALEQLTTLQQHKIQASASTGACLAAAHQLRQPGEIVLILSADGRSTVEF